MTYRILLVGMQEVKANFSHLDAKIEETNWEYLKSFSSCDMIIVDNSSVNSKTVRIAVKTKKEFREFITNGGNLVCLCCAPKNYAGYKSYGWFPEPLSSKVKKIPSDALGLWIRRSRLEKFLERQKNNITVECYFSSIEDSQNTKVIATTGLGQVIAFSKKLRDGEIICLPQFKDKGSFLTEWLEFWIGSKPDWLDKYQYEEKAKILRRLEMIEVLEKLLYGDHSDLSKAVAIAFEVLGFKVSMGGEGTGPDIYISYDDFTGIVEVKGLKRHADLDDMRALLDYYDAHVGEQTELKGIFVVNHYRTIEPKRKENKESYSVGAVELAKRKNFCLLTTTDLYFALEKALDDSSLQEVLRNKIIKGVGCVKLS